MGFKVERTDFNSGKNILASEHFQYIEAGATLDAAAFGNVKVELGTLLARNKTTGKYVKFAAADEADYDDYGILDVDVTITGGEDEIVGSVIVRGSVYEAKLPVNADLEAFKTATLGEIRFVKHHA